MLTVSDLFSGYGRIPVLHGVSLNLAEGECVGIWGHNGMGKTTLLSTILGYQPATQGRITLSGEDITRLPTHQRVRKGLGIVPQGRQIFPALTVSENLRMGCIAADRQARDGVEEVLELFPRLKPLLTRVGGLLSGGEQQLLALARCLCGQPRLMMLDEPTEGIQPSINEEIVEALSLLRTSTRLTLLIVEQRREFIAALSDRVLIMQKGMIVKEATPVELLRMDEFA
jgi:urea ABC transporter ATP-binding protein UrtE